MQVIHGCANIIFECSIDISAHTGDYCICGKSSYIALTNAYMHVRNSYIHVHVEKLIHACFRQSAMAIIPVFDAERWVAPAISRPFPKGNGLSRGSEYMCGPTDHMCLHATEGKMFHCLNFRALVSKTKTNSMHACCLHMPSIWLSFTVFLFSKPASHLRASDVFFCYFLHCLSPMCETRVHASEA